MKTPFAIHCGPDRIIRGDWFPSRSRAAGTVVVCHGYKGFKDWGMFPYVAGQLSEKHDVITFNFSHNGIGEDLLEFTELEKFARNTYSRELEDLHTVVRSISQGTLPLGHGSLCSGPIYLLGHSRGAGVCLIYAFDHPSDIRGVISWNGITHVDLFSAEEKAQMREAGRAYTINGRTGQKMPLDLEILQDMERNAERFNILKRAEQTMVPIVLIQGTDDFDRLRRGSERLMAAQLSIKRVDIEGGGHTFEAKHPFQGTTKPLETAIQATKEVLSKMR